MNNIQLNDNSINFKATPKEIKNIEQACKNIANSNIKDCLKEPVDTAEIGNKAYISSVKKDGKFLVKVELKNKSGANAYTLIKTGSPEETKRFFNMPKTIKKLADVIDSLKETLKNMEEREY